MSSNHNSTPPTGQSRLGSSRNPLHLTTSAIPSHMDQLTLNIASHDQNGQHNGSNASVSTSGLPPRLSPNFRQNSPKNGPYSPSSFSRQSNSSINLKNGSDGTSSQQSNVGNSPRFSSQANPSPHSPSRHSPSTGSPRRDGESGNGSPFGTGKKSMSNQILNSFTIGRGAMHSGSSGYAHLGSPGANNTSLGYQNPLHVPSLSVENENENGEKMTPNGLHNSNGSHSGRLHPQNLRTNTSGVSTSSHMSSTSAGKGLGKNLGDSLSSQSKPSKNGNANRGHPYEHYDTALGKYDQDEVTLKTFYPHSSQSQQKLAQNGLSSAPQSSKSRGQNPESFTMSINAGSDLVHTGSNLSGSSRDYGSGYHHHSHTNHHHHHHSSGDHEGHVHLDLSDTHSAQSKRSHYSHNSRHSRHSIQSRASRRREASLAQAMLAAPPSVSRSVRFSNQLTIATSLTNKDTIHKDGNIQVYRGGEDGGEDLHGHLHRHGGYHQHNHSQQQSQSKLPTADSFGSEDSYEAQFKPGYQHLAYQQESTQRDFAKHNLYLSPKLSPTSFLLPHKDTIDDASSVDINDSDEEHQVGSDIPYSITGHLKYPPSEHLRYEYIRNDSYHNESIPTMSINRIERHNVVYEQEKLLKRLHTQKALENALKRQEIAKNAPPHTCNEGIGYSGDGNGQDNGRDNQHLVQNDYDDTMSDRVHTTMRRNQPLSQIPSTSAAGSVSGKLTAMSPGNPGRGPNGQTIRQNSKGIFGMETINDLGDDDDDDDESAPRNSPSMFPAVTFDVDPTQPYREHNNNNKNNNTHAITFTPPPPCESCEYELAHPIDDELESDYVDRDGFIKYSDDDLARPTSLCDFPARAELMAQLHLAIPLILSFSAAHAVGLVNLSFQGHLDERSLAAAAMSLFYQNLSGNAILYGLNGGIDSFGSQYYGAGAYKMVGLVGLRGAAIGSVAMVLVTIFWWFTAFALGLFGIEAEICQLAQDYCRVCTLALPPILYLDVLRRVLEVQQICIPSMIVNVVGVILVVPLNWFFMDWMGYGFLGPAYSFIIINYAMFFALLAYFFASGIHKLCLPSPKTIFSRAIFQNWGQYLSIALPSVGAIAGEWLAFELQTIVAAKLNDTSAIAAQSLITSINAFAFNVPMSIGIACSCRVGAFLGARKPSAALLGYKTSLRITWVAQFLMAVVLWLFQAQILSFFTSIESVTSVAQTVMPMLSLFVIADGFQGMMQGIMRAFSAQRIGFFANMFWFWVVALPVSYFLTLSVGSHDYGNGEKHGLGLIGIWSSLLIGSTGTMVTYLAFWGYQNGPKEQITFTRC